jgi:rod shape-determining protein MreC
VQLAPERFASRRDTLAFVVCIVLSVSLRVAPVEFQFGMAAGIRSTVLLPLLAVEHQIALLRTARAVSSLIDEQRDSLALDALELLQLREENRRLRELLQLSQRLPGDHVSADVLQQATPTGITLLVSAGRNQGVEPMAPVVAPGGLLGVTQSVGSNTSAVLIWTHPDFRASAMTEDGSVFGIVAPWRSEGPNVQLMELRGVPFRQEVPEGSKVYTSGLGVRLGGVYPRGIPLGTVAAIGDEQEGWSRTYVVRAAVHPASVSHVIILTGSNEDVSAAFEADSL